MDKECVALCEAMNKFPGIRTTCSCYGHDKQPYSIWFDAESLDVLPRLIYYFDVCHCGFGGWRIVARTDCGMSPVFFKIEGPVGAYLQSERIAELLEAEIIRKDTEN